MLLLDLLQDLSKKETLSLLSWRTLSSRQWLRSTMPLLLRYIVNISCIVSVVQLF
jgi:hypothetical protein